MKAKRQALIREIVESQSIQTQEELAEALRAHGMVVTQATVSRDIRDLRLFKVVGVEKKYRYASLTKTEGEVSEKMRNLFKTCVLKIEAAQNLIVVKTMTGNGANAGAVVDKFNIQGIVGSVAGDDTLLVICHDNATANDVAARLSDLLK